MDIWAATEAARQALADDLAGLSDEQWHRPTLCGAWDVEHVLAHLTAVASTGRRRWVQSIVLSGFRPAVHNDRRLREHLGANPQETLERFRAAIPLRIAPSKDLPAFLGEVLVHAEDIRHPLGIRSHAPIDAATVVAEFFAGRDFAVRSRSMAAGLHLRATDGPFETGAGPLVEGSTLALVMVMAGRAAFLADLAGGGVGLLGSRVGELR